MATELETLYIEGKSMPLVHSHVMKVHSHWCPIHEAWFYCGDPYGLCDFLQTQWCEPCARQNWKPFDAE